MRGSQTPSTLQPLSLTLHKLGRSSWRLVSQLGNPWPGVCRLPICCSFSPHAVTFCLPPSTYPTYCILPILDILELIELLASKSHHLSFVWYFLQNGYLLLSPSPSFSSILHPPNPKSLDKLTPTSPALYSPHSPPLSLLYLSFQHCVTQINQALSFPLLFSQDIVYICPTNHWKSLSRPHRCCNNTGD